MRLYLKLENCQTTGSFKIRGVASQFDAAKAILLKESKGNLEDLKLITMSAGMYAEIRNIVHIYLYDCYTYFYGIKVKHNIRFTF